MPDPSSAFLHVGHLAPDPFWRMQRHDHPHHETIVLLAGKLHVELGGEDLVAARGDVLHYPAGVAHRERSDEVEPCDLFYCAWRGDDTGLPTRVADATGRMRTLLSWYEHDDGLRLEGDVDLRHRYLALFFAEYRKAVAIAREPQDLVHRVVNLITARMHEPLALDDLAAEAGLSRSHFVRTYRRLRGITPMEELRRHRVERARRLLITGDDTLARIAEQVGLADPYHLSRLFRRIHGIPPGAMRRARR